MKRDLDLLRTTAGLLSDDLNRALGIELNVRIDDDYCLTAVSNDLRETVLLGDDVDEDNWPPEAWSEKYRAGTLEDDASEVLADELGEILRVWNIPMPVCKDHGNSLSVCSFTWLCGGPHSHDVNTVGQLWR